MRNSFSKADKAIFALIIVTTVAAARGGNVPMALVGAYAIYAMYRGKSRTLSRLFGVTSVVTAGFMIIALAAALVEGGGGNIEQETRLYDAFGIWFVHTCESIGLWFYFLRQWKREAGQSSDELGCDA